MLLQKKDNGTLVEVLDVQSLVNPAQPEITARVQAGEEEQDPEAIAKDHLIFPSGESLPRCWMDAGYQK